MGVLKCFGHVEKIDEEKIIKKYINPELKVKN